MRVSTTILASFALTLFACSSSSSSPGGNGNPTDSGSPGDDVAVDTAPSCTAVGDVLCDVQLQGYVRNDTTGLASSATLSTFKLSDVFAQGTQPYVFIYNVAFWCSPCKQQTQIVIGKLGADSSKAMFVDLMVEGETPTTPATGTDLDAWIKALAVPFTTAYDADAASFAIKSTLGIKETAYVIDRTTRKILVKAATAQDALNALDALP